MKMKVIKAESILLRSATNMYFYKLKDSMSSQEEQRNEELAHRFHMDIFQKGDLSVADEILLPDFIWRSPSLPRDLQHGSENTKKIASSIIDSMPDRQITHDDVIAKGDKVLLRWTMTGTPKKEVLGIPPGDKPVTLTGFDLFRISGGRIVEMWQQFGAGKWP
jgi:predicted SnoaL-like aldol condensation-catalyzing enzyme